MLKQFSLDQKLDFIVALSTRKLLMLKQLPKTKTWSKNNFPLHSPTTLDLKYAYQVYIKLNAVYYHFLAVIGAVCLVTYLAK